MAGLNDIFHGITNGIKQIKEIKYQDYLQDKEDEE